MEALYYLIGTAALTYANLMINRGLGWLLTEWKRPVFAFKPFNCRPCLTFWLTLIFGTVIAAFQSRDDVTFSLLFLVAVLSGLINFTIIKSKTKIVQ